MPPIATRWAIETLFGNPKTRGLNFEDTRLTDPAKLHLLTALIARAVAWSVRAARTCPGHDAPPRKAHGYLARSYFRTGFTFLRNRLRSNHPETPVEWTNLPKTLKKEGVVSCGQTPTAPGPGRPDPRRGGTPRCLSRIRRLPADQPSKMVRGQPAIGPPPAFDV